MPEKFKEKKDSSGQNFCDCRIVELDSESGVHVQAGTAFRLEERDLCSSCC